MRIPKSAFDASLPTTHSASMLPGHGWVGVPKPTLSLSAGNPRYATEVNES